ncbi:MAG: MFS transporter [Acidobacteria bacterium]|nr:MFS transporter [Acidobacteriota bacterium]
MRRVAGPRTRAGGAGPGLKRATGRTFRSLRVRNYRLFFFAQLVSVSGTWMQWVAQSWLVLRLTHSGTALGLATAFQFLPSFLGGVWGGLVADRSDKRRILMITQGLAGALALALGALTVTGVVGIRAVYLLAFLFGCVTVVDMPARQSFVSEMVGPEGVPNAVALNSAVFNAGRIVGPALAAALIASVDLSAAFFVNGLSYGAVILALALMDRGALRATSRPHRARGQVREGIRHAWKTPELRDTILLVSVVATFGLNFTVVLPLLATGVFRGGAGTYSLLTSVMAAGALVGALVAASRSRPTRGLLLGAASAFGALGLLAAFAPSLGLESVLLAGVGGSSIAFVSTANSSLQLRAPAEMRGRVIGLYGIVFLGGTTLGGPLAGWTSEVFGARAALGGGALASLIGVLVMWWLGRAAGARAPVVARSAA